jgi:hypothetical protein
MHVLLWKLDWVHKALGLFASHLAFNMCAVHYWIGNFDPFNYNNDWAPASVSSDGPTHSRRSPAWHRLPASRAAHLCPLCLFAPSTRSTACMRDPVAVGTAALTVGAAKGCVSYVEPRIPLATWPRRGPPRPCGRRSRSGRWRHWSRMATPQLLLVNTTRWRASIS